jgi:hypothetical protein
MELGSRALDNLCAFARLFGYVRYFHPGDDAASVDWDHFAAAAVDLVERAGDARALAATLSSLFQPVAAGVRVYPTATPPADEPPAPSTAPVRAWRHYGGGSDPDTPRGVYRSVRVTRGERGDGGLDLTQHVDGKRLAQRRLAVRATVRAEALPPDAGAELFVQIVRYGASDLVIEEPIALAEWGEVTVTADIPDDAALVILGAGVRGAGRLALHAVSLTVDGEAAPLLRNATLRERRTDGLPCSWLRGERPSRSVQYRVEPDADSVCLVGEPRIEPDFPDPARPFRAPLDGGVACVVPLAVAAGGATAAVARAGDARATRIASVIVAWNVIQHFHPVLDGDWVAALRPALCRAAADRDDADLTRTLRELLVAARDGHARVGAPVPVDGRRLPIGWEWIEEQLIVTRVEAEARALVGRGDAVVTVAGRAARDALADVERAISAATAEARRWDGLHRLAAGSPGEEVALTIERPDGSRAAITLRRTLPVWPFDSDDRPRPIAELRPGVVYVDLARVTDALVDEELPRLAAARGLVFDVRGYPDVTLALLGHLIDAPIASPQWLLPITLAPDRTVVEHHPSEWHVDPIAPRFSAKAIFLADGRAMSYAETWLSLVEEHAIGEIVGARSAGSNGDVCHARLPSGHVISWTGLKVLKRDGSPFHGVGVRPTVAQARTRAGVVAGRDELLERALALLGG